MQFADALQNRRSKKYRKFYRKTLVLEFLLNKAAGLQDLLKTDSTTQVFFCEICEIFKNTLMVVSDRLRNVFTQQIFTIQLKTWSPKHFFNFLPSSYSDKMRWKRGQQLKSCLNLVYFHSYSFATGMTYALEYLH